MEEEYQDIEFFPFILAVLDRKKIIVRTCVGFVLAALALSFVLPKTYKAVVTSMPSMHKNSIGGQLGGLSVDSGIESLLGRGMFKKRSSVMDTMIGLITSNRVLDRVVERLGLVAAFDAESPAKARMALEGMVEVGIDDETGMLNVSVTDRNRERSAEIANAIMDELQVVAGELALEEATERRKFFSIQLDQVGAELARAENDLRGFQETTGVVEIQRQASAAIEYLAKLKALIAQKEVEIDVLHTFMTDQNPEIAAIKAELKSLREQAALLEGGTDSQIQNFFSTHNMVAAGTDFLRKTRDVKYYETLYYNISRLYEMARIDEAINTPVLQVIDRAEPPLKKASPRPKKMLMAAFMLGLLLSGSYAVLGAYMENLADDKTRAYLAELKAHILFWRKRG